MAAGVIARILISIGAMSLALNASCTEPVEQAELPSDETAAGEILFDLNEITLEQLLAASKEIDGLNSRVARNIIEFRNQQRFLRVEDLLSVPYVGETTYMKLRPHFFVRNKVGPGDAGRD